MAAAAAAAAAAVVVFAEVALALALAAAAAAAAASAANTAGVVDAESTAPVAAPVVTTTAICMAILAGCST